MFGLYFGDYLVRKNTISKLQYDHLMNLQEKTHTKLGLIAIEEKLLTIKQADEINLLQKQIDKRFGELALEKGYLVSEEINHLISLQKNSYLRFIQSLTNHNIMTLDEVSASLNDFKEEAGYTDSDIDHLKSEDINRIFSVYVDIDDHLLKEFASLIVRNLIRFISNRFIIGKSYKTLTYPFQHMASQILTGDRGFFIGFAGNEKSLLTIANGFAGETFSLLNEDGLNSIYEFLNCSSGLFTSKPSLENMNIQASPPLYYSNKSIKTKEDIYVIPIKLCQEQVDLIVSTNNQLNID